MTAQEQAAYHVNCPICKTKNGLIAKPVLGERYRCAMCGSRLTPIAMALKGKDINIILKVNLAWEYFYN